MKLKQFSKKEPCYYCGTAPPSKREHAPPDMMFRPFSCGRITVPSCETHNNNKSNRDRAIVTALIRMLDQQQESNTSVKKLPVAVISAIEDLKPDFRQANREISIRPFLIDPPEGFDNNLVYIDPQVDVAGWIRQLTAALVWSMTGEYDKTINWDDAKVWSRYLISRSYTTEEAGLLFANLAVKEAYYDSLDWRQGWSGIPKYPPDIYSLKLRHKEYVN